MNPCLRILLAVLVHFFLSALGLSERAFSSDWQMLGRDTGHSGLSSSNCPKPPLKEAWSKEFGCFISASPVYSDGQVYITGYDGNLHCMDGESGTLLWSRSIGAGFEGDAADWVAEAVDKNPNLSLHSECTPAVSDGRVFAGSYNGFFCAWDAATGKQLWRFATGKRREGIDGWAKVQGGIDSSPCVAGGLVYFGAWDGFVYALKAQTGQLAWKYDAGNIIYWSSPAVDDGRLYIGVTAGKLISLNAATGALVWERELSKPSLENMMCGPTAAGGLVFTGSDWGGSLYALNAATGEIVWSNIVNGLVVGSPAVRKQTLYSYAANRKKEGTVYAFDARTGKQLWQTQIGGTSASCPAIVEDVIYVTTYGEPSGRSLFAIGVEDGEVIWKAELPGIWGSAAIGGGKLFVGTHEEGRVLAFIPEGASAEQK